MKEKTDKKFIEKISRDVGRAINRYSLIEDNDKIALGLSGGKDSLVLLDILATRRKRIPINYEIHAVHVDIENIDYVTDIEYLESFCKNLDVPFHLIRANVDMEKDPTKSKCFICSWQRRKELFNFIKRMECGKLALGHHRDDVNETLIMNMIFNGSFGSMPAKLNMFDGEVNTIRPLVLISEESTSRYSNIKDYPQELKRCPYGDKTNRNAVKEIINNMEKLDKNAKNNIFSSMSHIHEEYLIKKI